jgi:hypothetical protein
MPSCGVCDTVVDVDYKRGDATSVRQLRCPVSRN